VTAPLTSPAPGRGRYLFIAAAIVAADQLTKLWIDRSFELHQSRVLIDGLLRLTYVQNHGAAFGLLADAGLPNQALIFTLVSLVALGAIAVYAWRLPSGQRLAQHALACVMGGAVGNLIDRARHGYVIDFVDVHWGLHHWPAFNVADSAISVGVALLVLDVALAPRSEDAADAARTPPATSSPDGVA
jgi:signal peptidase II